MQTQSTRTGRFSLFGFLLVCGALVLCAGCEPYSTMSSTDTDTRTTAATAAPAPETEAPAEDRSNDSTDGENEVVAPKKSMFTWNPGPNNVRMVIPANVPHWLLHISTTTPAVNHQVGLYGPDRSGGRLTSEGFEYVLKGGGANWRSDALAIDSKGGGAIVVFINTNHMQPSGYRTAHWIVPDPRQFYTGPQEKY